MKLWVVNEPVLDQGCTMEVDIVPHCNISVLLCIIHMVHWYDNVVQSVQKCENAVYVVWTKVSMVEMEVVAIELPQWSGTSPVAL